jgi:hypothetical protein
MASLQIDYSHDLPDGWIPVDVVSVVKCLDSEGNVQIAMRQSGGLNTWEAIGMLTAACDAARGSLQADLHEGGGD